MSAPPYPGGNANAPPPPMGFVQPPANAGPPPVYPALNQEPFQQPPPMGYGPPQPQQPMPMVQQPPPMTANSPASAALNYLMQIDQLLVHQKVELLEAFIDFETANKYTVKNSMGQKIFYAVEDNDCCTRNCCGPRRPFDMKIFDNNKVEVMRFSRPFACQEPCFPCCLQSMEIECPPGNLIGSVHQNWTLCLPQFSVKDADGNTVLKIHGPLCTTQCRCLCGDVEFEITTRDGSSTIGKITKQWAGLLREAFSDADYFGITFPMDLDVNTKATLMGALFLIDYMFYERNE